MISTVLRRIRPIDLLLPIGAALISAGLQSLADREERQRGRLDELARLVDVHRDALAAAGVELAPELLVDESSPVDELAPVMMVLAGAQPQPQAEPDEQPRPRRAWKLAALALAGVAGVTLYSNRGRLVDELFARAGVDMTPDEVKTDLTSFPWPGDHCTTCGEPCAWFRDEQTWRHVVPPEGKPRWSSHAVTLPDAVNESNGEHVSCFGPDGECETAPLEQPDTKPGTNLEDHTDLPDSYRKAPEEFCGWHPCDWASNAEQPAPAQRTAAAVHRNSCTHRPAGARVPGA